MEFYARFYSIYILIYGLYYTYTEKELFFTLLTFCFEIYLIIFVVVEFTHLSIPKDIYLFFF